jgi:hypothetical protein
LNRKRTALAVALERGKREKTISAHSLLARVFAKRRLRLYNTFHGLNCTSELGEDTIARRVRYTAPMLPNEPVKDCAPFGQPFQRADLVRTHETAVAFDIGCEDRDEASADCHRV